MGRALQRVGGALHRVGGARPQVGGALQRVGGPLPRVGGALHRVGGALQQEGQSILAEHYCSVVLKVGGPDIVPLMGICQGGRGGDVFEGPNETLKRGA